MNKKILCLYLAIVLMIPMISLTAMANSPPSTPEIDGPTSGQPGTTYTYDICSEDPDGDDITYCINWGDGSGDVCIGPFPSGTCTTVNHAWSSAGTYTITVVAKDTQEAESDPSTLNVNIKKSRVLQIDFIYQILEQFPILSYIFGLLF